MIVRIALTPEIFGATGIKTVEDRIGAEAILKAALANGIIVTAFDAFVHLAVQQISSLPLALRQSIAILFTEVSKQQKRNIAHVAVEEVPSAAKSLINAARTGKADVVVGTDIAAIASVLQSGNQHFETVPLDQYIASQTERRREAWTQSQQVDQLAANACSSLFHRILLDAEQIIVADKMFGVAAKAALAYDDAHHRRTLDYFSRGALYLAEHWTGITDDIITNGPKVNIVTVGGDMGAKGGYGRPEDLCKQIHDSIRRVDHRHVIRQLTVTIKQDGSPPIFKDRFVWAAQRCWGIRHGLDDIGKLAGPATRRSPTAIDPDCPANRSMFDAIRALPTLFEG